MKDLRDYDLSRHNTFGIAAKCRRFVEFGSVEELQSLIAEAGDDSKQWLVVGAGSNLLLTGDYDGTVVHSAIMGIEHEDDADGTTVRVGSGVCWDDLVATAVSRGWHGAENLSLIPGEVGASAVQNIGAYGAEVKDLISSVEAVDTRNGQLVSIPAADCDYGYRHSRFKTEWRGRYIITHVCYRFSHRFEPNIDYGGIRQQLENRYIATPTAQQLREIIIDIRREKLPDPTVTGNAGSFFKNPVVAASDYERLSTVYADMPHWPTVDGGVKLSAAWLIDRCGWKGRSMGRAGVHDRQALVLVNRGGATGREVVELCEAIRKSVSEKFGVDLQPEVNIV